MKMKVVIFFFMMNLICLSNELDSLKKTTKQEGRWRNFWHHRLLPDGSYPDGKIIINEIEKFLKQKKNNHLQLKDNWTELGPSIFKNRKTYNDGNGRINCIRINPLDNNEIWIGTPAGGLWKSKDGGNSWNAVYSEYIWGISDIEFAPSNPKIIIAATGDAKGSVYFKGYSAGLIKSTDGGESWNYIKNYHIDVSEKKYIRKILINPVNADEIFVATSESIIFTNDGGESWQVLLAGKHYCDLEFNPSNNNIIYTSTFNLTGNNFIYRSDDYGKTWKELITIKDCNRIELVVNYKNPDKIFALCSKYNADTRAELYISQDKGENFVQVLDTNYSKILVENQGFYNLVLSVHPENDSIVFIGGIPLHLSTDAGKTWNKISYDIHVDQHDLVVDTISSAIYSANDGGIYKSTDMGQTWKNLSNGLNITQFYNLDVNPYTNQEIIGGSQDNGVIKYTFGDWQHVLTGDGLESKFCKDNPNIVYTFLQAGQLFKSTDGGMTFPFINITNNINEPRPWGAPSLINNSGDSLIIGFQNLWQSTDAGVTWNKITDLKDNKLLISCLAKNEKTNSIYFSTDSLLFKFDDNIVEKIGEFKSIISDLKILKDTLYISFGGFNSDEKIFKYNGTSFENLSYNLPNIPMNKIDFFDNFIFAAGDAGVFRKDMKSNNWNSYSNGMPYMIVSDLKVNEGSQKLYASTYGRGIWEKELKDCETQYFELNYDGEINLCPGDSIILEVKNPVKNQNYKWSNGINSYKIKIGNPGNYYAVLIDSNGCNKISNSVLVNFNQLPVITLRSLGKNPICENEVAIIEARASQSDSCVIFWSNGAVGDTAYFNQAGTYFAIAESKNGCRDTSMEFEIVKNPNPKKPIGIRQGRIIKAVNAKPEYQISWYRNSKKLENESDSLLAPNETGTYQLKYTDSNYCTSISDQIIFNIDDISENPLIYPNPANDLLNIDIMSESDSNILINLYDVLGNICLSREEILKKGYHSISIDLSKFSTGMYYIKIGNQVRKFMKI